MRLITAASSFLAFAATAGAQQNPFALDGGPAGTARITYQAAYDGRPQVKWTAIHTNGVHVLKSDPVDATGKPTGTFYVRTTPDSNYLWSGVGKARAPGSVEASVRGHLSAAFKALDRTSQQQVLANLRMLAKRKGEGLDGVSQIAMTPAGKGSYAGHTCDRYRAGKDEACVLTGSSSVMLYWSTSNGRQTYTATSVRLGGSVAPELAAPQGVRFRPSGDIDGEELFAEIYGLLNPETEGPPALTEFARTVMRFLARPDAIAKLEELNGG